MKRTYDTNINDALWDAFNRGRSGNGLPVVASRDVLVAIDEAGFDIVKKPDALRPRMTVTTTRADGSTETLSTHPETPSDRAAFWAPLLISNILRDGGRRQRVDGIDEAGQESLVSLDRLHAAEELLAPIDNEKERRTEHMSFSEDDDCWTLSGDPDTVQRVLDLVKKGEAAERAERNPPAPPPLPGPYEAVLSVIKRGRPFAMDVSEMLLGIIAGHKVRTGRVFEVTYRKGDEPPFKVQHIEYVQIGGPFFDPPAPPELAQIEAAGFVGRAA